jgi:hypothetical protein
LGLYDRFELLELRRDDGIQTYHAREIATARPVQVHVLGHGETPENIALLARIEHLPEAEWRRVIERGEVQSVPYVVTDRLAGHPGFREWLTAKTDPTVRQQSLDAQFLDLFDSNADTRTIVPQSTRTMLSMPGPGAFEPNPAPIETQPATPNAPPASTNLPPVQHQPAQRKPTMARSVLAIGVGILAAVVLLALIVAIVAFRRH